MIKAIIVGVVAFAFGTFAFAQIIGSLQNISARGIGPTLLTLIIWGGLTVGSYFLMQRVVPDCAKAYYIGLGISLVIILFQGKIE